MLANLSKTTLFIELVLLFYLKYKTKQKIKGKNIHYLKNIANSRFKWPAIIITFVITIVILCGLDSIYGYLWVTGVYCADMFIYLYYNEDKK